jgi:hypothetical protein
MTYTNQNHTAQQNPQTINLKTIFENLDLDQTKVKFRELAHIHHPDKGGDGEKMKQLITSYKTHLRRLESQQNPTNDKPFDYQIEKELIDKIEVFAGIQGIVIELIGKWIWVSGDTKSIKDQLKENSFRYASKKQLWYFRQEEQAQRYHKSGITIDEIRSKYGSFSPNCQNKSNFQPALS